MLKKSYLDNFNALDCRCGFIRKDLCGSAFADFCKNFDESFFDWQQNSKKAKFARFAFDGKSFYIKKFYHRSSLEKLKNLIKGSRAFREFRGNELLRENGVLTPTTAAIIERKDSSFIITEEVQSVGSFFEYVTDEKIEISKRRYAAAKLAQILASLHGKNIILGDINMNNALIEETDGDINIYILDNERTRKVLSACKGNTKNLVQLNKIIHKNITLTERLRFYKHYAKLEKISDDDKNKLRFLIYRTKKRRGKNKKETLE